MANETLEVINELDKDILKKTKLIEINILVGKGPTDNLAKIEMLAMISDELSDVLLNWEDRIIDSNLGDDLM
jgi:hypothetical protein